MITLTDQEIVERFRLWKRINKWSCEMVARRVNCDRSYVQKVITGKKKPSKRIVKEFSYLITSKPVDFTTLRRL